MGLFDGRRQRPMPVEARLLLRSIPSRFRDDGCSRSFDSWFGFDFRPYCRIHDWSYCTRCHRPGRLTAQYRLYADRRLRRFLSAATPLRWRWLKWFYWAGVHLGGGISAFDSCGPDAGVLCRHDMPMPEWMERVAKEEPRRVPPLRRPKRSAPPTFSVSWTPPARTPLRLVRALEGRERRGGRGSAREAPARRSGAGNQCGNC